MTKENKTIIKATVISTVLALAVVWASNNVDFVEDIIG